MTLKDFIIKWNSENRYDYWWRQKYKIPFNSEQHRNANPIDIKFEYLEYKLAQKSLEDSKVEEEKQKKLEQGIWINESVEKENEDELWNKMKLN